MINKRYLKLLRSQQRFDKNNFIYNVVAKRIIDSLDLLNVDNNNALEIGINENATYNYLKDRFNKIQIDRTDLSKNKFVYKNSNFFEIDLDNLNLKKNFYNIIYSNLFIFMSNSFENSLKNIFDSLKSNGFFITAIPDKENMFQLLNSMYETDLYLYNGAYSRINPTLNIDNILPIFKKLSFNSPSIHSDTLSIEYSSFKKLLLDVKNMNLSYCYSDKKQKFENKKYFKILEEVYKKKFYDKNYILDIKINFVSGWKK